MTYLLKKFCSVSYLNRLTIMYSRKGEYEEPDCCYSILLAGVKNTRAEGPFLSILQHLLLVTDDINVR